MRDLMGDEIAVNNETKGRVHMDCRDRDDHFQDILLSPGLALLLAGKLVVAAVRSLR